MRMELGLSQQQTLKQIQTLSPQMYMSMEILCLNALDLEERIDVEVEDNVALEVAEPAKEPGADSPTDASGDSSSSDGDAQDDGFDERFEQWTDYSREEYSTRRGSGDFGDKDGKLEALTNTEGRPASLQEHLEQQVDLLDDDEVAQFASVASEFIAEVRALCRSIVYNLSLIQI